MESFIYSTLHSLVSQFDGRPKSTDSPHRGATPSERTPYFSDDDYDVSSELEDQSISEQILSKRLKSSGSYQLKQSSGYVTAMKVDSRNSTPSKTSRSSTPRKQLRQTQSDIPGEHLKIREFIDIQQMMGSLQTLQTLVQDPNIKYDDFRERYIESSIGLFDSIKNNKDLKLPNEKIPHVMSQKSHASYYTGSQLNQKEIVMEIITMCYQIFKVSMELLSPLLIQLMVFSKAVLSNDLVRDILNVSGEILLLILTMILDALEYTRNKVRRTKRYQQGQK